MLPRERVEAVYERRPTDRVPIYHSGFSSRMGSAILGREAYVGGGIQQWRESRSLWEGEDAHEEFLARSRRDAYDLARALDMDLVRPAYWRLAEKPTRKLDENTFYYGNPNGAWIIRELDPATELFQVVDQSPSAEATLSDLPALVDALEEAAAAYVPSEAKFAAPFGALAELGHERAVPVNSVVISLPESQVAWLEAIVLRPDLVRRYTDAQAVRMIRDVEFAASRGIRFFMGSGDFAGNGGPFFSPQAYRDLILPAVKCLTAACHRLGAYYTYASDGNLWPVAEYLFGQSGIDGYFEVDRRAGMDLAQLRKSFPSLTVIGNISSHTLHIGTREEVISETLSCLDEAKRRGGIMVGCSNQVVAETPVENLFAMLETIQKHR